MDKLTEEGKAWRALAFILIARYAQNMNEKKLDKIKAEAWTKRDEICGRLK